MKTYLIFTILIFHVFCVVNAQQYATTGSNTFTGNQTFNGSIKGNASGNMLRIQTTSGYLDIGPANTSWSHFYTDRPAFYFDKPIHINNGTLSSYSTNNLYLQTGGTNRISILNSNGNVGIGTTNPQSKLDVNGDMRVVGTAQIEKLLVNHPNATTNWNNSWQSGFYDSLDATNAPESSGWFWGINMNHTNNYNPTNMYGGQIAIRNSPTSPTMYFRSKDINGAGTWAKVLHSVGNQQINGNLDVAGFVRAQEVRVCLNQGCDYVFGKDYKLMNLNDLSNFVKTNKHLPEVAPAAQMEKEGINVSEMNALLLKKVEELTLYILQQEERIKALEAK